MGKRLLSLAVVAAIASGGTALGLALTTGNNIPSGPRPLTAAQVAARLSATSFTDCGPAPLGGVTDSGTAYLTGVRIGIDTFPAAAQRDAWLKAAASLGIAPWDSGATWVSYKAVSQHGPACG